MIVARETIYAALWAKASAAIHPLTGLPAFVLTNRRLRSFDDVSPSDQPAMFMVEDRETPNQVRGLPPRWDIAAHLWIYDNCASDPAAIPGQRLNYLLDAVDNALAPDGFGYQTLGGVVSHCWISGPIDIFEGYKGLGDQSVAIVPVSIRVPDASPR